MDARLRQLQRRWVDCRDALWREQLQDESNPDFLLETVALFFTNSEKLLRDLFSDLAQQNVDFKRVDAHIHQLKGSSSSIGAKRVTNACIAFRDFCRARNHIECLRCLQQLKEEFLLVKNELETLFELENQIVAAGGSIPKVQRRF
ncbi:histidine-containing phosphotransfer protein 1-like isoform X2 [Rhodamnia argentea]|uniref:Histidine-containing phosphotransfer protein n=1 Tax=Rhodamnia argentea TaxID=178133 RepID=A0A8B8N883_9MYRT|nr:histidine-containing phosphotransfer protein 1-like isoform X2 [Rhodamnia argentea]